MIRVWSTALLLLGLSACQTASQTTELRLLSYNIHHGEGLDRRLDLLRLGALIKKEGADLVALQEVDHKTGRSLGIDQSAVLAQESGLNTAHFGKSIDFSGGGYGNALLQRWASPPAQIKILPVSGEGRSLIHSRINVPGLGPSHLIGTHLDYKSPDGRRRQVEALLSYAATLPGGEPAILMGDFNAAPTSPEIRLILEAGWIDATAGLPATSPADQPRERIDYIFIRPGNFTCQVLEAKVIEEKTASDHRPNL
ncbi:MAG: hypothetical protein RL095_4044 [Verrucomicrobiota bacterium]